MPKIMYKDENIGGSYKGATLVEVTQAQYNALSDSEKEKDTLFVITDGVPSLPTSALNITNEFTIDSGIDISGGVLTITKVGNIIILNARNVKRTNDSIDILTIPSKYTPFVRVDGVLNKGSDGTIGGIYTMDNKLKWYSSTPLDTNYFINLMWCI